MRQTEPNISQYKLQQGGCVFALEPYVFHVFEHEPKFGKLLNIGPTLAKHRPHIGPTYGQDRSSMAQHAPTWAQNGPNIVQYRSDFAKHGAYLRPIMGPPPHVTPNRAYVGPMLGLCLAKMGPMFGDWTISKNVEKHRILEQKCPPPS